MNGTTSLPGEDVPGLLDAMTPRQREAWEAARAADKAEVEEGAEICHDHGESLDLTDAKVYLA